MGLEKSGGHEYLFYTVVRTASLRGWHLSIELMHEVRERARKRSEPSTLERLDSKSNAIRLVGLGCFMKSKAVGGSGVEAVK